MPKTSYLNLSSSRPLNQLYHPTAEYGQDSWELIYTKGNLNSTKFTPIFLKEWFYLLQKNGILVIDYQPNHLCDWQKLEEIIWWLWPGQYQILFHGPVSLKDTQKITETKLKEFLASLKTLDQSTTQTNPTTDKPFLRFICQKTTSTLIKNDSIDSWTFGIITNGKRPDWLKEIIQSIRIQHIPHYQIIICGTYQTNPQDTDITYLPFNQRDDRGWITRKKNLIVQHAQYQNLCLLHDRIVLDPHWYSGMKQWGNCFEILVGQTFLPNHHPNLQYLCFKGLSHINSQKMKYFHYFPLGNLSPKDWDKDTISYSANFIVKKNILLKNPYHETLFWKDFEDLIISQQNNSRGYLVRMNSSTNYAMITQTIPFRYTFFKYDSQKLGKLKHESVFNKTIFYLLQIFRLKRKNQLISKIYRFFSKFYS